MVRWVWINKRRLRFVHSIIDWADVLRSDWITPVSEGEAPPELFQFKGRCRDCTIFIPFVVSRHREWLVYANCVNWWITDDELHSPSNTSFPTGMLPMLTTFKNRILADSLVIRSKVQCIHSWWLLLFLNHYLSKQVWKIFKTKSK